jgi:hypothetical protein
MRRGGLACVSWQRFPVSFPARVRSSELLGRLRLRDGSKTSHRVGRRRTFYLVARQALWLVSFFSTTARLLQRQRVAARRPVSGRGERRCDRSPPSELAPAMAFFGPPARLYSWH